MTQREEFEQALRDMKIDIYHSLELNDSGNGYKDTHTTILFAGFRIGREAAKAQAMPEVNKELLQSLYDMIEIVGANFCSNQDVKRKYKIARELLEQNK